MTDYGKQTKEAGLQMMEPSVSIVNVGRLFKGLSLAIFILLVVEVALGVAQDGLGALPLLLLEVAQLLVIAGLLWGGGDLTRLVVQMTKDIRATRILLWQISQLRQIELGTEGVLVDALNPEGEEDMVHEDEDEA